MWASFTRDEKRLFLVVVSLFGLGAAVLPVVDAGQKTRVFEAAPATASASPTALSPGGPALSEALTTSSAAPPAPLEFDGTFPGTDLNSATAEMLEALPGIGPSRAGAILELRRQRGAFRTVEELEDVPGIGPATLAKLRPLILIRNPPPAAALAGSAGPPAFAASAGGKEGTGRRLPAGQEVNPPSSGPFSGPPPRTAATGAPAAVAGGAATVNINTADAESLASLKYVGPKLAQRIIDHRTRFGSFRSPNDLDKVNGIGRRVIAENYGRIAVR